MDQPTRSTSPASAIVASVFVPGLGYWLLGQRGRAMITGGGVLLLFVLGILFAGVRVINIPGYQDGYRKYVEVYRAADNRPHVQYTTTPALSIKPAGSKDQFGRPLYIVERRSAEGVREERTPQPPVRTQWVLLASPFAVLFDNLWFLGQMLLGPITFITGYVSNLVAQAGVARSYGRLWDVGSLYTAVAGMLNLMLIIDAGARAARAGKVRR